MSIGTADGTWAVVTGASRGIGRATALALSRRGVRVALVGRESAQLAQTATECGSATGSARTFHCDLSDLAAVERVANTIESTLAPAFLFNVAGVIQRQSVATLNTSALREQLDVNLLAPILLARGILPAFSGKSRAAVINVGSISSTLGTATQSAYNASKWGLVGFTKSLALELTGTRALTVVVLPGAVDTDMLKGSGYPPRMTADEVAQTLLHYALDAALAHNGAIIEMFGD